MSPQEQERRRLVPVAEDHVREYLISGQVREIPDGWIRPEVRQSWQRCLDAGLDPQSPADIAPVSTTDLKELRELQADLYAIAKMEVRNLYSQIAGSNFMVAFATPDAIILETVADSSFHRLARRTGIIPGSTWQESIRGTNALGCVSFTESASVVHASEHFFGDNCTLTCVASPVFDHHDRLIGVVDASSDCHARQVHTVALIRMAALHIEAETFRHNLSRHLILQFHNRQEFVHTLEAGLIAVDWEGNVVAANRKARFFLQDLPVAPGQPLEAVFRKSFDRFLAETAATGSGELTDHKGSTYRVLLSNLPYSPATIRGAHLEKKRRQVTVPSGFVCEDPRVLDAIRIVEEAIPWRVPIFIRGETGCGKELLARHVHAVSGRKGKFVAVNCTALPETLIESEFFGYQDGAFTGSRRGGARGLIRDADQGTLFLDEIGDMPITLQARLLRFLDQGTVRALGCSTEEKVDVQILAATNCAIEEAVELKRFRTDLLYRIRGVEISLPPLRERTDFAQIVKTLLHTLAPDCSIADEAIAVLKQHRWPGNFRELKYSLVRMLIAAKSSLLLPSHALSVLNTFAAPAETSGVPKTDLKGRQGRLIIETYQRCHGNVMHTAKELAVSRNTVYRELRRSGLR